MAEPPISVVIANLDGEPYLRDCLGSLHAQRFKDFEVIVVDNGSRDGSLALIEREFSWVKVIALEKNEGFARGNNVGFEASKAVYVATLNNDTIADPGWLEALHEAAEEDPRVGMVASKILLGRKGKEIDSVGMLLYPDGMTRQRGRGETDQGQYDHPEEVLFPSACAALYRKAMLDEIGGFDEDFFSYCEDSDLGFRARIAGWKAVSAPGAVVRHLYSQTGGKYSAFKAYQIERNHHWVLWKGLPFRYVALSLFYRFWRYVVQAFGMASGKGSVARLAEGLRWWQVLFILIRADLGAAFRFLPVFFIKRRAVWKKRKVPLIEFLELLRRYRISARELMLRD
ncbi:MAG: glycosyltransferase family 2 protein [Planctomycetota bacterium]|jgi:GT2 family glycosyltransferase